uniref:CCDC81 HU domain-containing protein n=2 Tax=Palpitomonas bilix TaxID=652834 RepID=A0A7S3GMD0_9EUKA|mmetsp:Transcript_9454/g.25656  ORF Transcript_9454/g.25656 Transcript_9454/m.25656 type:complete len:462 (+) Transcript_9454:330-1715(+)
MPQFARFAWRVESEKGDSKLLRPIFILSESFGKSHNLRYKKGTPKLPGLVGCEDINYAKLAIRFTSTLSKDNVYTAMRDLVQKLGSTIADGRDVRVDFRVGRLVAKDKRVDFLFDPEFQKLVLSGDAARNARISMPMTPYGHTADTASGPSYVSRFSSRITSRATTPQVPQSPAVTQNEQVPVPEKHAAETLMNDDAVEIESAREASPEEFHIPDSTKVKDKDVLTDLVSRTLGVGSLNSTGGVSTESRKDQLADAFTHVKYPTCIPGGSPPKKSSKVKAREAVTSAAVDAAYERYGSAIEQTEEEERRREFVLRQRLDSVAAKEKYEMLKKMDEKKQLQEYLHKQIDERKSTQNSELGSPRVDSPASSTFTPVYPIEPDNGPIRERKDIEKEYLRRVLEHQVSDAKKVKDLRRQKELEADLAMLAATTEDMKASILHELQEKDEAKKALYVRSSFLTQKF